MSDIAVAYHFAHSRSAAGAISREIVDAAGIAALDRADWQRLAANAAVENPFFGPGHVLAGIATIDAELDMRALLLRAADGRLVGFFPFTRHSRTRYPLPVAFGACNDFQYAGTPLVEAASAPAAIEAFLDHLARTPSRRPWVLRNFELNSGLGRLLLERAAARGMALSIHGAYDRAFLTRLPGGFEAHVGLVLSKNRLKDVRRTQRRLEEVGALTLEHATTPVAVAARLEDFLALENSGWKGGERSSILARPGHADHARRAYAGEGVSFDTLLLDGRPIAMKLTISDGRTAFTPKIAYDESLKKLGPGMVLEYKLLEAFYAQHDVDAIDAAATATEHSALNFFNTTKRVGTLIIGPSATQVGLMTLAHHLRDWLAGRRERAEVAVVTSG